MSGSRRRPWVAALLGFAVPGLGHLYAGLHRRAALILVFFPAAEILALVLMVLLPFPVANVLVPVALVVAARAYVAADAARAIGRMVETATSTRFGRWYALLAAAVLVSVVVNPSWAFLGRRTLVEPYRFPTGSMEDTILNGDHILASRWRHGWPGPRPAKRGEIVVFPYPEDPSRSFCKRIIGLPGETVEIRGRTVVIDGKTLDEPYARFIRGSNGPFGDAEDRWGPAPVPPASYFVLGDNRDNSKDSRHWGFVKEADLLARARVVYWSIEPGKGRMRWNRIGRLLQ